ncbi:ribonuclease activity regulator RraA [Kaistia sp. 32K]|uniref:ribonuclease activity regulator RraA n=1 Tax=Kaistia sp. 32K TaxID=2795690 RepID=UPI001915C59A|nr:ribonuclease activity regulator RraA [Kaistia sp. 32K]BCP54000.1 ribonuclease activity regulator RraA [Kaistia sp. 32K]
MSINIVQALKQVSTATITTFLFQKGLKNVWIRRASPLRPGQERQVGAAFTLRFVPAREDLATESIWSAPISTRAAVEDMPAGCIAVADTGGVTHAGSFGDILCARMKVIGVSGLVTDGAIRDRDAIEEIGFPVWSNGVSSSPSTSGLTFVDWQRPISCGGVAVFPGDYIVADGDGAVVVPPRYAEQIAASGPDEERLDLWVREQVLSGARLTDIYPPDEAVRERFRASATRNR